MTRDLVPALRAANGRPKLRSCEDLFVESGYFTIRCTDKLWSGVWSDMTIEQVLVRAMKTPVGLTGRRGAWEYTSHMDQSTSTAIDSCDLQQPWRLCRCCRRNIRAAQRASAFTTNQRQWGRGPLHRMKGYRHNQFVCITDCFFNGNTCGLKNFTKNFWVLSCCVNSQGKQFGTV